MKSVLKSCEKRSVGYFNRVGKDKFIGVGNISTDDHTLSGRVIEELQLNRSTAGILRRIADPQIFVFRRKYPLLKSDHQIVVRRPLEGR